MAKPYVYRTGRRSYESKMRLSELQDYDDKLTFILAQAAAGKVSRGWQSDCAVIINATPASVSQIVNKRRKSPKMLEAIYQYVLHETKQVPIQDNGQRLEVLRTLITDLEEKVTKFQEELEGLEEAKAEELRLVEYTYQRRQEAVSVQLEDLEAQLIQLRGRQEEVQTVYDMEYADNAPVYVEPESPRDKRLREIEAMAGTHIDLNEAVRRAQARDDLKRQLEAGQ